MAGKRPRPTGVSVIKLDVEVVLECSTEVLYTEVKVLCCRRLLGGAWLEFSALGKNALDTVPKSNLFLN
jgi:hypothetical protein